MHLNMKPVKGGQEADWVDKNTHKKNRSIRSRWIRDTYTDMDDVHTLSINCILNEWTHRLICLLWSTKILWRAVCRVNIIYLILFI